jgi:hypothetical protein
MAAGYVTGPQASEPEAPTPGRAAFEALRLAAAGDHGGGPVAGAGPPAVGLPVLPSAAGRSRSSSHPAGATAARGAAAAGCQCLGGRAGVLGEALTD